MRTSAALVAATLALAAGAAAESAEPPLSAIDWLSDSISRPAEAPQPGGAVTGSAAPGQIDVTPLDAPLADAAGLLPPSATGLPRALWGPATADEVIARLATVPDDLLPSLRRLLITVLLAEANPPVGSGPDDRLLLARTDRLLAMGALERAGALLERAGVDTPERFRRYFDIALLQGSENEACQRMRSRPDISPTYPARIFCLARTGDWQAAAVTLETAETLGILAPAEDRLLARFLDADIVNPADTDDQWSSPSPLTFRMLEAVGEPAATGPLPVAFAWADLRPTRGWKAQIEAAERLARRGVLEGNVLTGLYLRQRPSASGGVWERVAAVQAVQAALVEADAETLAQVLPGAWEQMRAAGLAPVFAAQYGAELAALPLTGRAADIAFRAGLLSPAYEAVALAARPATPEGRFLAALARGLPETAPAPDAVSLSLREGFAATAVPAGLQPYLDEGRIGEALLRAITLFSEGAAGDPDGLSAAVALLRGLGLESAARRASLELLLLGGDARP